MVVLVYTSKSLFQRLSELETQFYKHNVYMDAYSNNFPRSVFKVKTNRFCILLVYLGRETVLLPCILSTVSAGLGRI